MLTSLIPKKIYSFTYQGESDCRLDIILNSKFKESRSLIQKFIKLGFVKVNQLVILKPQFKVDKDSHIEIFIEHEVNPQENLAPYNFPIEIIFENNDFIVVNKPPGLVVHPGKGNVNNTLVNALIFHNKNLSDGSQQFRPGVVHRLDKGTSGLIIIAKNNQSHSEISELFAEKSIRKTYWAMVLSRGRVFEQFKVENYLSRHPKDRIKFSVDENEKGKKAISYLSTLYNSENFSLVEIKIETGRTHQIRVHLSHLGCPIVFDSMYSNSKQLKMGMSYFKNFFEIRPFPMLHAKELSFEYKNEKFYFESPLEEGFQLSLNKLRD